METVLELLEAEENLCMELYEEEEQYGSNEAKKRAWAVYMEARKIREFVNGLVPVRSKEVTL